MNTIILSPDQYVDLGLMFVSDTTAESIKRAELDFLLHDFERTKKPFLKALDPKSRSHTDRKISYLQMVNGLSAAAIHFHDLHACQYALECAEKTGDFALLTATAEKIAKAASNRTDLPKLCVDYLRDKGTIVNRE